MKYLPKNTLAYYNAAPQFHTFDLSSYPLQTVAASTAAYKKENEKKQAWASPDDDAVVFYALNHCAAIIRKQFSSNEKLPDWAIDVMGAYLKATTDQGQRLFHYLMCIITREARHIQGMKEDFSYEQVQTQFGKAFKDFISKQSTEANSLEKFLDSYIHATIGQYVEGISFCFYNGVYGSSYGGKPWGNIADCVLSFVQGKTSLEMMVDTGYTLAHNTAPIFNKGMMYSSNSYNLITLLDIQRSGQVPEMVLENLTYHGINIPTLATQMVQLTKDNTEGQFKGFVDWYKVEEAGSVAKYAKFKAKQIKLHPESKPVEKVVEETPQPGWVAPPVPWSNVIGGHQVEYTGDFQVFPGQVVKTFKRVKKLAVK